MDVKYNNVFGYMFDTKARVIINIGGRDSGKSYFVGGQYIPALMLQKGYFRGMTVKKTYSSCEDSVYKEITDGITVLNQDNNFNSLKSPLNIKCKNGNSMIFRGLDKPKNLKSIKGLSFIWFEEAEDLSETEFDDLLILLRGGEEEKQKIVLTYNPVDEDHFTNDRFVKCKKDRILETFEDDEPKVWEIDVEEVIEKELVRYTVLVIKSTYKDNDYMTAQRKLVIEKLQYTNFELYEVYAKARFGTRGGLILNNVEQIDFMEKEWYFNNFDKKGYVQDFGYNHANCIHFTAERDNNLYIFDEIYVHEKEPTEIIALANRKISNKKLMMICDSAEPGTIKTWCRYGYNAIPVYKYPGSVKNQIDTLKSYNKIYINTRCVNTWKEAKQWKWKQTSDGRYTDQPVDVYDDGMACLRYSKDLFSQSDIGIDWLKAKRG